MGSIAIIRSGGQTGADRGGLDAARACGVPICGWVPAGGLAEDLRESPGLLVPYPELVEIAAGGQEGYVERTELNVRDSHATLVVAPRGLGPHSGTEMTVTFAEDYHRPCLVVRSMEDLPEIRTWMGSLGEGITLNIAGPRGSKCPEAYTETKAIVETLLREQGTIRVSVR